MFAASELVVVVAAGCCEATAMSEASEEVAGVAAGCCVDTAASMASEDGVVVDVADGSFVAAVGCSMIAVSGEERMVKSLRQIWSIRPYCWLQKYLQPASGFILPSCHFNLQTYHLTKAAASYTIKQWLCSYSSI